MRITNRVVILTICIILICSSLGFASNNDVLDKQILQLYSIFENEMSFEEFEVAELKYREYCINNYANESVDLSIEEYISCYIEGDDSSANAFMQINTNANVTSLGPGRYYYNTGYGLPQEAVYNQYDLVGNLQRGDIFVEEDSILGGYTDHAGIVEGCFYSASMNMYYIRVVESISAGVCRGIIDDTRINEKECRFYRLISNNEDVEDSAASFAVSQIGEPWHIHDGAYSAASHYGWYCSELVWAAYLHAGVDLVPSLNWGSLVFPNLLELSTSLYNISID